ncbi:MAG: YkgJ family cysteine cluster protein [Verrucomicrobia bacterium]|nr:YkgJ family cysteine cluster protein [Verrucomicrobiota bacterium]
MKGPADLTRLSRLCLSCGLCCNGVLFAEVCLVRGDDPAVLRAAGLPIEPRRPPRTTPDPAASEPPAQLLPWRLRQPCAALAPNRTCVVYQGRPARCRTFECALFQQVQADAARFASVRRRITATQRLVSRVNRLLVRLGESDVRKALFARIRTTRRRFERQIVEPETAAVYADLTLAAHQLRLALDRDFCARPK